MLMLWCSVSEAYSVVGDDMTHRDRILRLALCLLVCVGVAGLLGCKQEAGSAPARPLPEVGVMTVAALTIPDDPEFIGQAEASRIVEIRSQVTGIIKQFFFREGRDVKKGDRLYLIDPVPFQAAVVSAKAMVAQAEARLVQAKQNLGRVKPLLAEQAVSQKDLDNTLIIAPISGLIERTKFYEGRLISAQTDLLTVIHQVDPMYIVGSAPENYLLQRRRDLASKKVERPDLYQLRGILTFMDGTTYPYEAQLDFASVRLSTETGSRQGRFVFPNHERVMLPGQFVKIRVKGYTRTGAILVPQRAVQQGPKGSVVYVVGEGDKVEVRNVQATSWQGSQWLIEEGLRTGERVVVDGLQRIAPGAPVKPIPAADVGPASVGKPTATMVKGGLRSPTFSSTVRSSRRSVPRS